MREFEDSRGSLLNPFHVGQVCKGTVRAVTDFGAFVDLDGVTGVVTAPNLSWVSVDHPSQVVRVGQEIVVVVLSIDTEREQVSVSIKDLQQDPLLEFARLQFGSTVSGTVIKVAPIGIFVKLGEIVGLLPCSEMRGPGAVEIGDSLSVKVSGINIPMRQVALTHGFDITKGDN
ncbi:S1 RNA-binding domain-containing protein [Streptomyces sp. NPDC059649]|uniref:S1 RNA-binding domain-containing protein n=1 Tax=Streptomyces sp. NPDC059649 TaxID=3346895 RepID=UPI0036BCA45D